MANTFFTEMPSDCATCWSNAVARMASPCLVARKNQAMPAIIASETTRLSRYTVWIFSPRTSTVWTVNTGGKG